ncbi:hypothetical protein [Streptomyces sp. NPDC050264]|uniref:hypothetical protein n=1 Tax=Streptomyces sp. NPDC050264 TaxID=3155038 RepID=UPI00343902FD
MRPAPPPKKRTGLIVAGAVVGSLALLAVIGALLPNTDKGDDKSGASGSSGAGGTGGGGAKRPDPEPASYKGIDLTEDYYLKLGDSPPKPLDGGDTGAMYMGGDLYYYDGMVTGDQRLGTDNGKLVLLNNAQKGSPQSCRTETRYTDQIDLDQLSAGSQICVRSDAGHIAVVTYRGKSGSNDPSRYVTVDVTVWRNAEEPTESD